MIEHIGFPLCARLVLSATQQKQQKFDVRPESYIVILSPRNVMLLRNRSARNPAL